MKKLLFILIVFGLLILSGCNKELSKQEAEERALNYVKEIFHEQTKALSNKDLNEIEKNFSDLLIYVGENIKPVVVNSSKEGYNWHVLIGFEYWDGLYGDYADIVVSHNKVRGQIFDVDVTNDCDGMVNLLKKEGIKEERKIMNKACLKVYMIYITNPLVDRYAIELKEKWPTPDFLTDDDFFPETLSGYPMISISNDSELHRAQYGNFGYGNEDYKILEENNVFINVDYERINSTRDDVDDYFVYVGNNRYYEKSEFSDNKYIVWYNGDYEFKLIVNIKEKNDDILFNAFKELKY